MGDEVNKKKYVMTAEGVKALEDELDYLKVVKMKEISIKIGEAREQGDLSENAEYDAAKDEQRDVQARIDQIEEQLKHAEIVDEDQMKSGVINIGCNVKIHDNTYDEDLDFKIVGSTESNSLGGKISNESPLGQALIGAKVGDVVEVVMPDGTDTFTVLEITRNN